MQNNGPSDCDTITVHSFKSRILQPQVVNVEQIFNYYWNDYFHCDLICCLFS